MLTLLFSGYLFNASIWFCVCLSAFLRDRSTPKSDRLSWVAVLLVPSLWPIALPLMLLELAQKQRLEV